jgi:hypothetical protein
MKSYIESAQLPVKMAARSRAVLWHEIAVGQRSERITATRQLLLTDELATNYPEPESQPTNSPFSSRLVRSLGKHLPNYPTN